MDSAKLNDWLQVIGIFALVASLIFVGFQMKQEQEIAIANQYQARATTAVSVQEARDQSEIVRRQEGQRHIDLYGWPEGFDEEMSAEEFGSIIFDARRLIYAYDNNHYQYHAGFLPEDTWQSNRKTIQRLAQQPIYHYLFEASHGAYRPAYVDVWYGRDSDQYSEPE